MSEVKIDLEDVYSADSIDYLYQLLKQRKSWQNISHKEMPSFEAHYNFVQNHPYLKWWIITLNGDKVGQCYVTRDYEIGMFLDEKHTNKGIGSIALRKIFDQCAGPLYANINPKNNNSRRFFEKHGFQLIENQENQMVFRKL